MRKCKCGRAIPDDWYGDKCFYCWLGYKEHPLPKGANRVKVILKFEEDEKT